MNPTYSQATLCEVMGWVSLTVERTTCDVRRAIFDISDDGADGAAGCG